MLQPSQVLQDPLALSSCSGNIYQQDQKQNVWILLKIMGFPAGFVTSGWATAVHKQITNHSGSWDIFRRSGEQYLKFTLCYVKHDTFDSKRSIIDYVPPILERNANANHRYAHNHRLWLRKERHALKEVRQNKTASINMKGGVQHWNLSL